MGQVGEHDILNKATKIKKAKNEHIPSTVQADTLFTFTSHVDYLITTLKNAMVSPRYCVEDLSYLKIQGIKKMAFPMKCFCDINMHKLELHLSWYGYYGLAFSKEWGMANGIQPIQYINPTSLLREDFASAFNSALKIGATTPGEPVSVMKSYLLHQLMYYKPYSGMIENRNTKKRERKCFTDECEWRYIPSVSDAGFQQVYYDKNIINAGVLNDISNSMEGLQAVSLKFEYADLKYIIVKSVEDFVKLTEAISTFGVDDATEHEIISKVIIWENSKGGFLMFVDFDKVFHETPQPQAQIPPALVSYLSSKLPAGVRYVIDKDGNCVIDGDGKPFTLGGYVSKITGRHKEILGENFTKEDVQRYFYNIQKPIPLELKKPGYVLLNGEEFPVEKLFLNPHNPISVKSGKFFMSPKAFPAPVQIDVGCDSYTRKITISRVTNESVNIATFESEKNAPLGVKLFINEDNNTLSLNMSLKLSNAKTIRDIVESASIFNAFLFGKGVMLGKPMDAKLSAEGVKPFDESSIAFWVKVLKIEEHLGISFTPPQEDIDFKTICLVEKLYQNLINNTPIRDDVKPESLDGKWETKDENDIRKSIGKAIYFEFDATSSVDLFGARFELCGVEGIMNAVLERFTKVKQKYTLHLTDISEDKPRKCVSIFFRNEEERAAYRAQDHQKRIKEFDNAKRAREYLN